MVTVSGIRGIAQKSFTEPLIRKYTQAFGALALKEFGDSKGQPTVVCGRDSRVSGPWALKIVHDVLTKMGFHVVELGIVPTPTVQFMVQRLKAIRGIIITSSHNPIEWNGLKFVGSDGLFLSPPACLEMFALADAGTLPDISASKNTGSVKADDSANAQHIKAILSLPEVSQHHEAVKAKKFKVVLDTVNGAGGPIMKELLTQFGCEVVGLNIEPTGEFSHPPEPIPEHLGQLAEAVKTHKASFGVATDPDVDRCVFIDETGNPIGEEYTLAMAVEFWLGSCGKRGNIVKNLSSSMANDEIAKKYGCTCHKSAVAEINVAYKMLDVKAIIGGEGNGGVMLPDVHIGRDAPVALGLVISLLSQFDGTMSQLKASLPQWYIVKMKTSVEGIDADARLEALKQEWLNTKTESGPPPELSTIDGLHIQTNDWWVHIRKSNTEPIVRVIAEARTEEEATLIAKKFLEKHFSK